MRLHNLPVVPLNLLPKQPPVLDVTNAGDYLRVLSWMYQFPQALNAYIASAPDRGVRLSTWLPDHPLSTLLFIALVVNWVFVWWVAVLYSFLGILLGDADVSISTLAAAALWGQSLLLLTTLCIVIWQQLSLRDEVLAAYIRTLPSYVAVYTAAGIVFGKMLLNTPSLISSLWIIGVALGVAAGSAVRVQLLNQPVLLERTIYRWMLWGAGVCIVLVAGMWVEARDAIGDEPGVLYYLYEGLLFAAISISLVVLRPDDWLLALLWGQDEPDPDGSWDIPHVTLLPYAPLAAEMREQLQLNWREGVRNVQRLERASYQLPYMLATVRQLFAESAVDDGVERAETVVALFDEARLFAMAPEGETAFAQPVRSAFSLSAMLGSQSETRRQRRTMRRDPLPFDLTPDSAARAALAGFWYLHRLYPERAADAFERTAGSERGHEMLVLSQALQQLLSDDIESVAAPLLFPQKPGKVEHEATWNALQKLQMTSRCVWVLQRSFAPQNVERMARIATNHLIDVRDDPEIHPSEKRFLQRVAGAWLEDVNEIAGEQLMKIQQGRGRDAFKTVENPFAFAGPLLQKAPVGRKALLARIHRAWSMGNLQPLLVFGQSLVGKTSLVRSAQQEMAYTLETVFVNLRRLSPQASAPQLLQAITNEVADLLALAAPSPDAWQQDEHFVFQSFISQACRMVEPQGLVVILDEFDHLENIIGTPAQRDHILRFLWDLGQAESQLGFVFITRSTPAELHSRYDNPFAGGLAPVHVRRFSFEEAESLLRAPAEDFLPYLLDESITLAHELTGGHPYLLQIIGHGLIERYNRQMLAKQPCDPVFGDSDVLAVLNTSDFHRRAEFCYQMLMGEAQQGGDCMALLQRLASTPRGMSEDEVKSVDDGSSCIQKLFQHDMIVQDLPAENKPVENDSGQNQPDQRENEPDEGTGGAATQNGAENRTESRAEGRWYISIELWRKWLEEYEEPEERQGNG